MNELNDSEESEEEEEQQVKKSKKYFLTIKPEQTIEFTLKFSPKEVRTYKFLLPLELKGYGQFERLSRFVKCRGLKPKFIIDPQTCEFKKKIISTPDKCFPSVKEIIISNPDREPVKWKVDVSQLLRDKVFAISPTEGEQPAAPSRPFPVLVPVACSCRVFLSRVPVACS